MRDRRRSPRTERPDTGFGEAPVAFVRERAASMQANDAPIPIDRRVALSGIAAAGAMLIVPRAAKAEKLDVELLALCRRAKTLYRALCDAEDALGVLEAELIGPQQPQVLITREIDHKFGPRLVAPVGELLTHMDIEVIIIARTTMINIYKLIDWGNIEPKPNARELLRRAVEIEEASQRYNSELAAAKEAAGIPQAYATIEQLEGELGRIWREIAFTRARTVEGVFAKLDAASAPLLDGSLDPEEFPDGCAAEDVAWMAASDLAAINEAT